MEDSEYEIDFSDHPLRQGDLFMWSDEIKVRPWKQVGMVVTADCDLEQNKTKGILSYIPGVTTEDYIWYFWKDARLGTLAIELKRKLTSKVNKRLAAAKPGRVDVSQEAVMSWLLRVGAQAVIKELEITDKQQAENFSGIATSVLMIHDLMARSEPDMELLKKCYKLRSTKISVDDSQLVSDLQSAIANLPGDVFHIPHVLEQPQDSIFLMLRHISQCRIDDVGLRPDDLRYGTASARRIGRISSPYRYAIMQNIGKVFTDIGLPDSHKERSKSTAVSFFTRKG